MRVNLERFLFVGAASSKEDFLQEAQKAGIIQFIEDTKTESLSTWTQEVLSAIKLLKGFPPQEILTDVDPRREESIVNEIHTVFDLYQRSEAALEALEVERREMAPYGHFDPAQFRRIEEKGGLHLQLFALKKGVHPPVEFVLVNSGEELDHYVRVGKGTYHLPNAIEIQMNRSISEVEKDAAIAKKHHTEAFKRLEELTSYRDFLLSCLVAAMNRDAYNKTLQQGQKGADGKVFSMIGWVPSNEEERLKLLAERHAVFVEQVEIKEGDTIPTYLKNDKWGKVGQDLVGIYDTPSSQDQDPSLWVLCFFVLFFSMIISDAIYGAIFLLIALYIRWKHPNLQGLKQRVLNLFTALSVGCVIWGVLAGGYAGIPQSFDSPLQKLSLVRWMAEKKAEYHVEQKDDVYEAWVKKIPQVAEATTGDQFLRLGKEQKEGEAETAPVYPILNTFTDQIILELALLVGALHLLISMARYSLRNWPLFGWILFLIGGYLYIASTLNYTSILNFVFGLSKETMATVGADMAIAGLVVMFILAIVQHRLKGLLEIMTMITILADLLSYLRLYALGLAGGIMSATIYEMSTEMNIFFAVIVMFLAHSVNMGLGVMGGVIHGLRLNFLEWYHYSFEGGGKPFRPLKELKKES